jgi:hypothetical protein
LSFVIRDSLGFNRITEKVFLPSSREAPRRHCEPKAKQSRFTARDKLCNLCFKEIQNFEIAAPALIMLGLACKKRSSQ